MFLQIDIEVTIEISILKTDLHLPVFFSEMTILTFLDFLGEQSSHSLHSRTGLLGQKHNTIFRQVTDSDAKVLFLTKVAKFLFIYV